VKKITRIKHPVTKLYSLKVLKNMTKFLGRRWRTSNMGVISDIYTHIMPTYMDDWLATTYLETDKTQDFEQEDAASKQAIEEWHRETYCDRSSNTPNQETVVPRSLSGIYQSIILDDYWKNSYREWLDSYLLELC